MSLESPVVPDGWQVGRIGDLFSSWGGHTPSKSNLAYWEGSIPWATSRDIKDMRLRGSTHRVTQQAVDETGLKVCPEGSVLVVMRSGILAHSLPVTVTEIPVTINQDLKAFHSPAPHMNEWLALFLRTSADELLASSRRDGTTVQSVQYPLLKNTLLPFPEAEERRRLLEAAEAAAERREAAQQQLATAQQAIERFRQAALAAACSGRLTADWREQNSRTEEKAEQLVTRSRHLLGIPERLMVDSAPSDDVQAIDVPASWTWAPLSSLAAIRGGIQKQPKRVPRSNVFPYLRVANVLRGRLVLGEIAQFELFGRELGTYRLEPDDLLVVEGNGSASEIGRCAIWHGEIPNCVHQNHIIRVRCVAMNPRFVELFWNSPIGASEIASLAVTSAGLYSLSTRKIGAVLVPVPPLAEQEEIVRRVTSMTAVVVSVSRLIEAAESGIEAMGQAVLAKAMGGTSHWNDSSQW